MLTQNYPFQLASCNRKLFQTRCLYGEWPTPSKTADTDCAGGGDCNGGGGGDFSIPTDVVVDVVVGNRVPGGTSPYSSVYDGSLLWLWLEPSANNDDDDTVMVWPWWRIGAAAVVVVEAWVAVVDDDDDAYT